MDQDALSCQLQHIQLPQSLTGPRHSEEISFHLTWIFPSNSLWVQPFTLESCGRTKSCLGWCIFIVHRIWNHLGDTPLGMSVRKLMERFNGAGKTTLNVGGTISLSSTISWPGIQDLIKREKWKSQHSLLSIPGLAKYTRSQPCTLATTSCLCLPTLSDLRL